MQVGLNSLGGYAIRAQFSCSNLPSWMSCQFSPTSLSVVGGGNNGCTLVISDIAGSPPDIYTITITGSDGVMNASTTLTLSVIVSGNTSSPAGLPRFHPDRKKIYKRR